MTSLALSHEQRWPRAVKRPLRIGGYTLLEMMTTIAALVMVLGLMVSLARNVRTQSGQRLTRELLWTLEQSTARYVGEHGTPPGVPPLFAPPAGHPAVGLPVYGLAPNSATVMQEALANNQQLMRTLLAENDGAKAFAELPASVFDPTVPTLRDAWGSPFVFVDSGPSWLGTAPGGRSYFVSAGPDRNFLTIEDNLYSYDAPARTGGEIP